MKTLSRTLAMLVSFQLFWACDHNSFKYKSAVPIPGVESSDDSLEISGSIARAWNLIMPSAVAAEGKLSLIDISNPDEPKEVTTYDITGTDSFSLKLKKEQVNDRILKLQFDSYESDDQSRSLLLDASDADKVLDASMDNDKSLQAQILEAQLKVEYGRGEILNHDQMKSRFKSLREDNVSDELELAGDKDILIKLMRNPKFASMIAEYLAVYRLAVEQGNEEERKAITEKLNYFLLDQGLIKDGVLKCAGHVITFSMMKEQEFNVYGEAYDDEVKDMFGGKDHLFGFVETGKFDEVMKEIRAKLNDVAKKYDKNVSATITVMDNEKNEQSCRLYAWELKDGEGEEEATGLVIDKSIMTDVQWQKASSEEEAHQWVSEAYEKTVKTLIERMLKEGIKEDSDEWHTILKAQIPEAKKLNESIHQQIYDSYHSIAIL